MFSLTARCNLNCRHCATDKSKKTLSKVTAVRFLNQCRRAGIKQVGFTGGEPFLVFDFLSRLVKEALKLGMFFDRIMTNAVWFKNQPWLKQALTKLYKIGYDGSICISVDVFHKQELKKIAVFIGTAVSIWQRPDFVSIAYISGCKDSQTKRRLKKLACILNADLVEFSSGRRCIKNDFLFIKLINIDLSPVGKAGGLKNPWGKTWFKEDYCQGPGNVLFVEPDGSVKPCCGYAAELSELTIGNIAEDSLGALLTAAKKNRYVHAVFNRGLSRIRKRLEKKNIKFPGKTKNHCFFCEYLLKEIPRPILEKCL